jgi:hypothetical protein
MSRTRWTRLGRALGRKERGQALVLFALVLTFLLMLILICVEVGARYHELAAIEDALQQATRSSVQTFDYSTFAQGGQRVREKGSVTVSGCDSLTPHSARAVACAVFITNLTGLRGLQETPEQTAARVVWTFHPNGGTCSYPNGRPPVSFSTPMACATLRPKMTGLMGWGTWSPQLDAADTLDPITK